jgi:hypothetical protein
MANRGFRGPVSPGSNSDESSSRYETFRGCQCIGGRARCTDIACQIVFIRHRSGRPPYCSYDWSRAQPEGASSSHCCQTELFDATPMNFVAAMLQVCQPVGRDVSEVARGPHGK